jgi:hypothetical protein
MKGARVAMSERRYGSATSLLHPYGRSSVEKTMRERPTRADATERPVLSKGS